MSFAKFLLVLLALGLLFLFHGHVLGAALTPLLEKTMTEVFDMKINVEGLSVSVWPAVVHADKIECLNPPGFRRRDHYTATGVNLELDLNPLKNKFIHIRKAHFKGAVFAVESYTTPRGSVTNVGHWYHHMGLDAEDPPSSPDVPNRSAPAANNTGEEGWRVRIDRLELEKGEVIFDDRREGPGFQWIFRDLKGHWTGFDHISGYTSPVFTETIELEGTFGNAPPAKFKGAGRCQFANGNNFEVRAEITDGSLAEYKFLLDGLPAEVRSGRFNLRSQLRCVRSDLDSDHHLTVKDLKFAAPSASQKLMKYPMDGVLLLLENQKSVELHMRVDGYIGDPKFRFFSAFTQAFRKALTDKAMVTLKGVGKSTLAIATETPKQVTHNLVKIAMVLTDPLVPGPEGKVFQNGGGSDG